MGKDLRNDISMKAMIYIMPLQWSQADHRRALSAF